MDREKIIARIAQQLAGFEFSSLSTVESNICLLLDEEGYLRATKSFYYLTEKSRELLA